MQYIVLRYDSLVIRARWRRRTKRCHRLPDSRRAAVSDSKVLACPRGGGPRSRSGAAAVSRSPATQGARGPPAADDRGPSRAPADPSSQRRGACRSPREARDGGSAPGHSGSPRSRRRAAGEGAGRPEAARSAVPRRPRNPGTRSGFRPQAAHPAINPTATRSRAEGDPKDGSALTAGAQSTGPPAFRRARRCDWPSGLPRRPYRRP